MNSMNEKPRYGMLALRNASTGIYHLCLAVGALLALLAVVSHLGITALCVPAYASYPNHNRGPTSMKKHKLRRIAMRLDEMQRKKRWKRRELADMTFGLWCFLVFVGCPTIFILAMLGVIR